MASSSLLAVGSQFSARCDEQQLRTVISHHCAIQKWHVLVLSVRTHSLTRNLICVNRINQRAAYFDLHVTHPIQATRSELELRSVRCCTPRRLLRKTRRKHLELGAAHSSRRSEKERKQQQTHMRCEAKQAMSHEGEKWCDAVVVVAKDERTKKKEHPNERKYFRFELELERSRRSVIVIIIISERGEDRAMELDPRGVSQ